MSTREPDVERGPEYYQATGMPLPQPMSPGPARTLSAREPPSVASQGMPPLQRNYSTSRHMSGMMLENPVLSAFRYHVGIHNDPTLSNSAPPAQAKAIDGQSSMSLPGIMSSVTGAFSTTNTAVSAGGMSRPAANFGIYQRVVGAEKKYHREYKVFSLLINGALGLQIIFAAALTALGAGQGPHAAVTAFGSLNTVLAGLLTFLKGSGLPNRLKYYENEWSKVREYIEQRERDFASDYHRGRLGWDALAEEIAIIESMYEGVRKDVEANTPDSYVSLNNAMKTLSSNNPHTHPQLARGLNRFNNRSTYIEEDMRRPDTDLDHGIRSGAPHLDQRFEKSWGDAEKRATVQVHEVIDEANGRLNNASRHAETRFATTGNSVEDALRRTESSARSHINDAQNATQSVIAETQHGAESKAKEIEEKIVSVAEKAAEKVLDFTRHRH